MSIFDMTSAALIKDIEAEHSLADIEDSTNIPISTLVSIRDGAKHRLNYYQRSPSYQNNIHRLLVIEHGLLGVQK